MILTIGRWRIPLIATIVTLVTLVILVRLGIWQLDRAAQKNARLTQISQRQSGQSFNLSELLQLSTDIRDLPLSVSGTFLADKFFLIDNRIIDGQVGYELVAILVTTKGNLAVNLGWLAAGSDRAVLPNILPPTGRVNINGTVAVPSLNPLVRETPEHSHQWPARIQQTDLTYMQQLTQFPLLPLVLLAAPDDKQPLVRRWQAVVMPPQKHIAYAIQWFGLALAALAVAIFAIRRFNLEQHNEQ